MSLSDLSAMTDLPFGGKKKTHRGRRSRGRGPKKSHTAHHSALNAAMAAGDHGKAKSAALMLANALHAKMKSASPALGATPGEPDGDDTGTIAPPMGGGSTGLPTPTAARAPAPPPFSKPY